MARKHILASQLRYTELHYLAVTQREHGRAIAGSEVDRLGLGVVTKFTARLFIPHKLTVEERTETASEYPLDFLRRLLRIPPAGALSAVAGLILEQCPTGRNSPLRDLRGISYS